MSYEAYLAHHGIKGQKWGVRRFQNYDGTRIKSNRKPSFKETTDSIRKKLSNEYKPVYRQPLNLEEVKSRGELTDAEAKTCSRLARTMFDRASKVEPAITADVISSADAAGAKMFGLWYRQKQPTSLAAKIGADAKEKGLSFEEAANGVKDTVRYTAVSENHDFVNNYESIKRSLTNKGYEEVRCKNFFEKYRQGQVQHKAVQCTYRDTNGFEFELQFQTPESQAAKELKIPLYEERRKKGVTQTRAVQLELEMRDLAEQVPYPPRISDILSHS